MIGEPWQSITDVSPPQGARVRTVINDAHGPRNEATLTRQGSIWLFDGGSYPYYNPTHWRSLRSDEA